MAIIFRLIGLLGALFTGTMTVLMLFRFRKERRIGIFSSIVSVALSSAILPAFMLLSGARLNLLLALPILVLGLLIGFLRGMVTKLHYEDGHVVGKNSIAFLIGWGVSLVLAQVLNVFGSVLLASMGLVPLFLSTGTQLGMSSNVLLRRLMMKPPLAGQSTAYVPSKVQGSARTESPAYLPERERASTPVPPVLPGRGRQGLARRLPER